MARQAGLLTVGMLAGAFLPALRAARVAPVSLIGSVE